MLLATSTILAKRNEYGVLRITMRTLSVSDGLQSLLVTKRNFTTLQDKGESRVDTFLLLFLQTVSTPDEGPNIPASWRPWCLAGQRGQSRKRKYFAKKTPMQGENSLGRLLPSLVLFLT